MRILVTGSSGGIGKWMVKRLLQAGHTVRSLDVHAQPPGGNEHLPGDVRDLAFVRRAMQGMEAVIHLAALPYDMPGQEEMVLDVNLRGTWNILLACGEVGVSRVVYFSSINALGQSEPGHSELYLPLDDEIPTPPYPELWYDQAPQRTDVRGFCCPYRRNCHQPATFPGDPAYRWYGTPLVGYDAGGDESAVRCR